MATLVLIKNSGKYGGRIKVRDTITLDGPVRADLGMVLDWSEGDTI